MPRRQPPSGGCVLKRSVLIRTANKSGAAAFGRLCVETYEQDRELMYKRQPPSGGCVLKHITSSICFCGYKQPPSGGCVLKQARSNIGSAVDKAAAFGRLCVETTKPIRKCYGVHAAAFGRLCVETSILVFISGGLESSRLRAAVC